MGNIIQQSSNNDKAYGVDASGNFSVTNNFTANTGTFNKNVLFNDNITIVNGKTINGVDITSLNSTVSTLNTTVSGLTGAGAGNFVGKTLTSDQISSGTGTFGNLIVSGTGVFGTLLSSRIDLNGNLNISGTGVLNAGTGAISYITSNTGIFTNLNVIGKLNVNMLNAGSITSSTDIRLEPTTGRNVWVTEGLNVIKNTNLSDLWIGGTLTSVGTSNLKNTNVTSLTSTGLITNSGGLIGDGTVNAGNLVQINQSTVPSFATTAMTGGANGLIVKGTSKWSIGEVKGTKTPTSSRLCFSLNDIPFACIDPTTKNLVAASDW